MITTKTVAAEARKLLSEVASTKGYSFGTRAIGGSGRGEYLFLEGLENVEPEIRKLFDDSIREIILERIKTVISRFPGETLIGMGFPYARS